MGESEVTVCRCQRFEPEPGYNTRTRRCTCGHHVNQHATPDLSCKGSTSKGTMHTEPEPRIRETMPPADVALVARAAMLAQAAHAGQVDKNGRAYFDHVRAVADKVAHLGPIAEAAALLHDTLEDTPLTPRTLERAGISRRVVALVLTLTRRDGETYAQFIDRIAAAGGLAVEIKLADLAHNLDPGRARSLPDTLRARYLQAQATLGRTA